MIALAFSVVSAGCTTAAPPTRLTPDRTPPVAAADFAGQLSITLCGLWVRCGVFQEPTECLASSPSLNAFMPATLAADIANGTLDYDGSLAADCLNKIGAASCSDLGVGPDENLYQTAECAPFMLGTVADGGACTRDEQCDANSGCVADPSGPSFGQDLPGTCTVIDNRICGPGNPPCPGNEACHYGGVCGGDAGAGDTCSDDVDCVKGLVCSGLFDAYGPTGHGTCAPAPGVGEPCDSVCDEIGVSCVVVGQTPLYQGITACLRDADRGEPCSYPPQHVAAPHCKLDSVCDGSLGICVDAALCDPVTHVCAPASE